MPVQREVQPLLVRRYGRDRLYNVTSQHYVTVQELRGCAQKGQPLVVIDDETNTDVTQVLLAAGPPRLGAVFH